MNTDIKKEVTIIKHKNTKHGHLKCEKCNEICKSEVDLKNHWNGHHVKRCEKYDVSDVLSSVCTICNKKCNTKTEVCKHFESDHMESIDDCKDQSL